MQRNPITESTRITGKYLNQDFSGLQTGQFLFLSDGQDRKVNISLLPFEREPLPERQAISEQFLKDHYLKIITEATNLF